MSGELTALALISEQISAEDQFKVWMFWTRDYADNQEQREELYLSLGRACQAATEWIVAIHDTDVPYMLEPPLTRENIEQWFGDHERWAGGVMELAVNITLR